MNKMDQFKEHRSLLFAIAYRMLGSAMEAEDITLWSDGGGKAVSAIRPIYGAANVAKFLFGLGGKMPANFEVRFAWINNQLGIVGYEDERPTTVLTFETAEGRIQAILVVRNPDKLRVIPPNVETDQMQPDDRKLPGDGRCSSRKV
jgi:RNA polymerase sigma-70 factor (ECF subfamily)